MNNSITQQDLFEALLLGIVDIRPFSEIEVIIQSRGLKDEIGQRIYKEDIYQFMREIINRHRERKRSECEQADGVP